MAFLCHTIVFSCRQIVLRSPSRCFSHTMGTSRKASVMWSLQEHHGKPNNIERSPTISDIGVVSRNDMLVFKVPSDDLAEHDKMSVRHKLQSKLDMLESVGCTRDQIHESPEMLSLSEAIILDRVNRLRDCGYQELSLEMIRLAKRKHPQVLRESVEKYLATTKGYKTYQSYMAAELGCNEAEWHSLMQRNRNLGYLRDMTYFSEKISYLNSLGYEIEDIKANIRVVNLSLQTMHYRILLIRKVDPNVKVRLTTLCMFKIQFARWLRIYKQEHNALTGFSDRYEKLAHMLNTSVEEVKAVKYFSISGMARLCEWIKFLQSIGLPNDEIIDGAYFLNRSLAMAKLAYDEVAKLGITKITMRQLKHIMDKKRISRVVVKTCVIKYVMTLLDCSKEEIILPHNRSMIRHIFLRGRDHITTNVNYLLSKGFHKSDIVACPLILAHDFHVLKRYVETILDQPELQMYPEIIHDRRKLLNVVQYLIESDLNFTSKEALCEEELDEC